MQLDPLEYQKKVKRRQRNKEAAARCRQRRLDMMNSLAGQVDQLTADNERKQAEIDRLREQKVQLEFALRNHHCHMPNSSGGVSGLGSRRAPSGAALLAQETKKEVEDFGSDPTLTAVVTSTPATSTTALDLKRPDTLSFGGGASSSGLPAGVSISTPSSGLTPVGLATFDSAIGGGLLSRKTGLTPISTASVTQLFTPAGLTLETPIDGSSKTAGGSLARL